MTSSRLLAERSATRQALLALLRTSVYPWTLDALAAELGTATHNTLRGILAELERDGVVAQRTYKGRSAWALVGSGEGT